MDNCKWNFWQALFLILIIYTIEYSLGWLEAPNDLGSLQSFISYHLIGIGDVLLSISLLYIFLRLLKQNFLNLGLDNFKLRYLLYGLPGGVGLFLCIGIIGNLIISYFGNPEPQSFALVVEGADSIWQFALLFFLGGIIVPLKEELIFRGLVYPPLKSENGSLKGILLASLFFAAFHFDVIRFIPLFIGGLGLTWLFHKTRSLWPSIIAHSTWNFLMIILMLIERTLNN